MREMLDLGELRMVANLGSKYVKTFQNELKLGNHYLAPSSCTVEYNHMYMSTHRVQSCSGWSEPILRSFTTFTIATPDQESYKFQIYKK